MTPEVLMAAFGSAVFLGAGVGAAIALFNSWGS